MKDYLMSRNYYYRKTYYRNTYSNEMSPQRAGLVTLFLCGLGIWIAYKSAIYNFFSEYGIWLIIMAVLLLIAILIIKKEYNKYKNNNSIQTNQTKINNTNLDQIKPTTYNNDLFVMDNEEIKNENPTKQNYAYNNYNNVIINEANRKHISEEENLEQITNINIFLKTKFREIFNTNEIYSISGYLRRLHPKIFEDLIELIFRIQGYDIVKRSTWRGPKGYRKANPDGGIDITCQKDDQIEYIQVKNTVNGFISSSMVRDFDSATVRKRNPGDKVKIITTTLFGDPAIKTANEDSILMIDYLKLNKIISSIYDNKIDRKVLQDFFINNCYPKEDKYGKYNNECPKCGAPLKLRKEGFYGCQNYYKTGCSYIRKTTTIDVVKNMTYC